jgi:uncharacterized RDD family membrane protein YckC
MPPYGSPYGTSFGGPRNLAGFWHRLGGHLLDGLLYGLVTIPFVIVGVVLIAGSLEDCDRIDRFDGTTEINCGPGQLQGGLLAAGIAVLVAGVALVVWLYLRSLARTGQTWGKRIAGLKVVNQADGSPPGWGKAIGRSLFKATISGWICYLGYLWMLWDGDKQTWHDKVAGTLVIRT